MEMIPTTQDISHFPLERERMYKDSVHGHIDIPFK